MQRLILLRHAEAERSSTTGADFDRALTRSGREAALTAGRVLADAGYRPELALVSAARRTIQTWEAAATAFPQARVDVMRPLFNADADTLMQAVDEAKARAGAVIVVAHNPGIGELAARLAGGDMRLLQGFPTAGAAVFEAAEGGGYRLLDLFFPEGRA